MSFEESTPVREFTLEGIEYARLYLESIRDGGWRSVPADLLADDEYTTPIMPPILIEQRPFEDRRKLGQYLADHLAPLEANAVETNGHLWSWLGVFYLESITGGAAARNPRTAFAEIAHIIVPSRDPRDSSHHRLKLAYELWKQWGEQAWYLLSQPANSLPQFTLRILQSPEIMRSQDIVPLTLALYVDSSTGRLRPKSTGMNQSEAPPGSLPRLIAVLNQLSMTYDVYGMTMEQLLPLLPQEFDGFVTHINAG